MNVQRPPTNIPLGRQGENLATCIIFDCTGLVQLYGDGTAELLHELKSGTVYPVAIKQDGASVSWIVTASDTATVGAGRAELRWYVGDTLAKSAKFRTSVSSALADSTTEAPPAPYQPWVDKVLAAAQEIKDGAISDEKLAAAIAAYLQEHPIDAGLDETALAAYLVENGYLTDAALADAIAKALTDAKSSGEFNGQPGADGKSAYQYAQDVGYTGTEADFAAKMAEEMPTVLPNPNALTFTGAVTGTYDGSAPLEVEIPSGEGGTGGSDGVFELIGEATSSGVSDVVGLTIPFDGSLYKTIIAYAYNLPAGNKKRIIIRKTKAWYDGSPLGWNSVVDSHLTSMTSMTNTWGFFGAAIDVDGKLFTFGAAEANTNGGHGYFRFSPQNGALPTLSLSDCKFISLDCNSNSEILPDGCSLVVWGVRK